MKLYMITSPLVLTHVYFIETDAYKQEGKWILLILFRIVFIDKTFKGRQLSATRYIREYWFLKLNVVRVLIGFIYKNVLFFYKR